MDKIEWLLVSIIIAVGIISGIIGATHPIKKDIVIQYDTITEYVIDSSLVEVNDSLCTVIDSLNNDIETVSEELQIATFKLERIKEYNRIAGNGNNIKYLRGWINRVLNE